jgi:anti-sigma factor RsiW
MNHDEAWDRIPWLVNGRADEAEREHLEAHLRVCEECRIEVAVQRQVMSAIANDKRIDVVPGTAFQRLWDRISADELDDEPEFVGSDDTSAPPEKTAAPVVSQPRNRPLTRWLAAAVIVEAVGLIALMAALSARGVDRQPAAQPFGEYRTVTSSAPQASPGVIRAVFQPTLRVSDLQQLLEQSGLRIVSGPTEAGVYTLASSTSEDHARVDRALGELRAHPSVRFAEPVGK